MWYFGWILSQIRNADHVGELFFHAGGPEASVRVDHLVTLGDVLAVLPAIHTRVSFANLAMNFFEPPRSK
jgi:hypothetical protein